MKVGKYGLGDEDTIVALGTPSGRSAIAVIRVSGPQAFAIAARIVRPWPLQARGVLLCRVTDPEDGTLIDHALVSTFPGPRSYTGEDTVEFSTHGGQAVPDALIRVIVLCGARPALAGEFTRRAVLNGKLDLVQAEAVGDLIDAGSESMRRLVLHQLDGGLSRKIAELRTDLLEVEALLAYDIDFPDEDDGPVSRETISRAAAAARSTLTSLLQTAPAVQMVRDGAIVVIAGPPNVGKSSLFNSLIGHARAIVADIPGTTRDAIEARVQFDTWPVRLVDTAGIRKDAELVEQLGIEVSERYLANAHAVIACDDDRDRLNGTVNALSTLSGAPIIAVLTKCDRLARATHLGHNATPRGRTLWVSALNHEGLPELVAQVCKELDERYGVVPVERPAITRARQRAAVETARQELTAFQVHWDAGTLPPTVAAVHIRSAASALEELIGAVDVEDVLGRVFATFCIGK